MSTAKNIIKGLEKVVGVENAFGSQELDEKKPYQDLLDAVEHDGVDWEHERDMELEADHADELE
jgi:hypothetical protein